mgnify:CR=1 FL=1
MKQLLAILLTTLSLSTFALDPATAKAADVAKADAAKAAEAKKLGTEPNGPTTSEHGVKLAKKKDHSKDKKVDATKSPQKAETTKK